MPALPKRSAFRAAVCRLCVARAPAPRETLAPLSSRAPASVFPSSLRDPLSALHPCSCGCRPRGSVHPLLPGLPPASDACVLSPPDAPSRRILPPHPVLMLCLVPPPSHLVLTPCVVSPPLHPILTPRVVASSPPPRLDALPRLPELRTGGASTHLDGRLFFSPHTCRSLRILPGVRRPRPPPKTPAAQIEQNSPVRSFPPSSPSRHRASPFFSLRAISLAVQPSTHRSFFHPPVCPKPACRGTPRLRRAAPLASAFAALPPQAPRQPLPDSVRRVFLFRPSAPASLVASCRSQRTEPRDRGMRLPRADHSAFALQPTQGHRRGIESRVERDARRPKGPGVCGPWGWQSGWRMKVDRVRGRERKKETEEGKEGGRDV